MAKEQAKKKKMSEEKLKKGEENLEEEEFADYEKEDEYGEFLKQYHGDEDDSEEESSE